MQTAVLKIIWISETIGKYSSQIVQQDIHIQNIVLPRAASILSENNVCVNSSHVRSIKRHRNCYMHFSNRQNDSNQ